MTTPTTEIQNTATTTPIDATTSEQDTPDEAPNDAPEAAAPRGGVMRAIRRAIGRAADALSLAPSAPGPPTDSARARLATCEENAQTYCQRVAELERGVGVLEAGLRGARAEFDRAALSATCSPSGVTETAMRDAEAAVRAAESRYETRLQEVREAQASHSAATAAASDARSEIAATELESKKVDLRARATVERFRERIASPAQRLLDARRAVLEAASEIDAARADSVAASAGLRELGESCTDIGHHHIIAPFILASLDADPSLGCQIDRSLHELLYAFQERNGTGGPLALHLLLEEHATNDVIGRISGSNGVRTPDPGVQAQVRETLERVLEARAAHDISLVREAIAARGVARALDASSEFQAKRMARRQERLRNGTAPQFSSGVDPLNTISSSDPTW